MLAGGCLAMGGDELPFTPFAAFLRGLVRELGADEIAAMLPGRGTPELAHLVPELGEPDDSRNQAEARARLFEEMLTLLGGWPNPGRSSCSSRTPTGPIRPPAACSPS